MMKEMWMHIFAVKNNSGYFEGDVQFAEICQSVISCAA